MPDEKHWIAVEDEYESAYSYDLCVCGIARYDHIERQKCPFAAGQFQLAERAQTVTEQEKANDEAEKFWESMRDGSSPDEE